MAGGEARVGPESSGVVARFLGRLPPKGNARSGIAAVPHGHGFARSQVRRVHLGLTSTHPGNNAPLADASRSRRRNRPRARRRPPADPTLRSRLRACCALPRAAPKAGASFDLAAARSPVRPVASACAGPLRAAGGPGRMQKRARTSRPEAHRLNSSFPLARGLRPLPWTPCACRSEPGPPGLRLAGPTRRFRLRGTSARRQRPRAHARASLDLPA